MKYRELTPTEIEAYNVGYQVGNRKIVITDIEWESENEHKIYRKGYMAGLMDYKRNVSKVSNVNNVDIETSITSTTPIGISISKGNKDKFNEDSIIYVNGQYFDEFPKESISTLKKYWTDAELSEIRRDMACKPDHETTVKQMLLNYPPKPKKKFTPPTETEWMDFCCQLNLDPKRMKSQFYAYQDNNWKDSHGNTIKNWKMKIRQVWDKPENKDPDADVPKGPKIADMSNFVRAKPLGEEE